MLCCAGPGRAEHHLLLLLLLCACPCCCRCLVDYMMQHQDCRITTITYRGHAKRRLACRPARKHTSATKKFTAIRRYTLLATAQHLLASQVNLPLASPPPRLVFTPITQPNPNLAHASALSKGAGAAGG